MNIEVKIPFVGETILSGVLTRWLKENDELVSEGEIILEMETQKANVEVPSPATGKIAIKANIGDEVMIGQIVAYIDTEFIPEKILKKESRTQKEKSASEAEGKESRLASYAENDSGKLSPAVRRIVGEKNVDVSRMHGSGKNGRITKGDILENKASKEEGTRQTIVRMSPIRSTIAKNLVIAKQESAHVTTFNELNMEHVINIRSKHKDHFLKHHGIKLGFMSFFVKACCQALKEFKDLNTMVRGDEIVYNNYYDIGVAVAVEQGLVVPVIKNADSLSFADIEIKINDLASRAREKKLKLDELQGGTFTITNGGTFGSMMSTPIPNHPQTAILGMHSIKDRPWVENGKIEIKPVMYVALTYDHRVIDGKDAVEFLVSVKNYIEDPESLLIEL